MKIKGVLLITAILALLLALPLCSGAEEGSLPPSPEPPSANMNGRPTPAPTEVPAETVINHIHNPDLYPDFAFQKDKKLFEIWFPNIRDADAALLLYDGQVWMIDCGDERAAGRCAVLLRQLGIKKIDILFTSHLHHDHVNGLAITNQEAKVGEVRICFDPELTESGKKLIWTAGELGIPVKEYGDGDRFAMGDGAVELLFLKNSEEYLDMNNQSAQTRITFGRRSILFMADMEAPGQEAMINRIGTDLLRCDIVKYPHHAKSDLYTPFFEAMGAKLAIVTSIGGRKDAGQAAMAYRKLPAAFTALNDKFTHLVTDGDYWLCELVAITAK